MKYKCYYSNHNPGVGGSSPSPATIVPPDTATRREAFYWLAILFTLALGTAAGDLGAEQYELGYLTTGLLFCAIIASFYIGYAVFKLNAILMFWLAYIFSRPVGASFGDCCRSRAAQEDSFMRQVSLAGVSLMVLAVAGQWWSKGDRHQTRHVLVSAEFHSCSDWQSIKWYCSLCSGYGPTMPV